MYWLHIFRTIINLLYCSELVKFVIIRAAVHYILFQRFSNYTDDEKESLRAFMNLLINASYDTFKDITEDNRIKPEDYLYYVKLLHTNISYTISNSHVHMFPLFNLEQTITELGICYSYNGEITPYNDYSLVIIIFYNTRVDCGCIEKCLFPLTFCLQLLDYTQHEYHKN